MNVLVIDDNPDVLLTTGIMFETLGCTVTKLNGPETVLTCVEENAPDLIVMDIGMPGQNGYDLCHQLRTRDFENPIIAHTGWGSEQDRKRVEAAGFDDVLVKPASLNDFQTLLKKCEK